jgi:hypothetical protein
MLNMGQSMLQRADLVTGILIASVMLVLYTTVHRRGIQLSSFVPFLAIAMLMKTQRVHANQMLKRYQYNGQKPAEAAIASNVWSNRYKNPLVGAPGGHVINLKKPSLESASAQSIIDLDKQFTMAMHTNVGEQSCYDRFFNQMPDPTLHNFRGVVFSDSDPQEQLPNMSLVKEPDFGGAVSSNKMAK